MPKFRKKPVEIEAFQLGQDDVPDWFRYAEIANKARLVDRKEAGLPIQADIHTLEGVMTANVGDWIIRGRGELMLRRRPNNAKLGTFVPLYIRARPSLHPDFIGGPGRA